MHKLKRLPENSAFMGDLPKGCQLCGPGQKMVLLITGKCSCRCFYCPLSYKKRGFDVIYANELKVKDINEILAEARAISGKGTGITGGDPMIRPELTVKAIWLLKNTFGSGHHIHLYTSAKFDPKYLSMLDSAGLDELRFHPPINTWTRITSDFQKLIRAALDTNIQIGSEIPVLPGYGDIMIKYAKTLDSMGVKFLNLNELEFSESNWEELKKRGFSQKNELANTVLGSEELALNVLVELSTVSDFQMSVHYCSAQFKDRQQLTNRLKRRAKNIKKPYFVLTDDGTFLIGIIEPSGASSAYQDELHKVKKYLHDDFNVPDKLMFMDEHFNRLEVAPWVLEELKDELDDVLKSRCFIIEEYPTADRLEVERIPIIEFK